MPPPEPVEPLVRNEKTRVVIAHPHALLRHGLSAALGREDHIDVVGEADQEDVLIDLCEKLEPAVTVVDLSLPGISLPESLERLSAVAPGSRVLLLADEEHEEALIQVVRVGGGYLTHGYSAPSLTHAVHALNRGEVVFPRHMLRRLLDRLVRDHEEREVAIRKVSLLSERERGVLGLLCEGANNDSIADALVISPQTARTHIQNILVKMDLHSRLEAVAYVRRYQLGPELERRSGR